MGGHKEATVRKWAACILVLSFGTEFRVWDHSSFICSSVGETVVRKRKGCWEQQIHIGSWYGQVEMAEMGRFLQDELSGESVAWEMLR